MLPRDKHAPVGGRRAFDQSRLIALSKPQIELQLQRGRKFNPQGQSGSSSGWQTVSSESSDLRAADVFLTLNFGCPHLVDDTYERSTDSYKDLRKLSRSCFSLLLNAM